MLHIKLAVHVGRQVLQILLCEQVVIDNQNPLRLLCHPQNHIPLVTEVEYDYFPTLNILRGRPSVEPSVVFYIVRIFRHTPRYCGWRSERLPQYPRGTETICTVSVINTEAFFRHDCYPSCWGIEFE